MSIAFSAETSSFTLRVRSSVYVIEARADGRLVHVGSAPASGGWTPTSLSQYPDADYIWEPGGPRYELPTFGDVAHSDVALKASFPGATGDLAPGEANHVPVRDLRLRYVSHEIRTDAAPALSAKHQQLPRESSTQRQTLVIHLRDIGYDFHVRLFYRVTPEYDVIERWTEIENRTNGEVKIESLAFGAVHFPIGDYDLTHAAGSWAREFIPTTRPIAQGVTMLAQQGLNTGHSVNPFYLVHERGQATEHAGNVYFGALAYSGNWSLRFEQLPTRATHVIGGYEQTDFELILAPGATHTTPAFVHGVADDGLGGASRRLHAFARDYILPGFTDDQLRPVLYNSWEATYFDVSADGQIKLARAAAEIGVELFCMDDGWFGARRNDRAGLGDWVVSPDQFPQGLKPLIDEVLRLGMRFGLWVEPEMVNPDSDLYRAHPDWILHFPGRPRTERRNQMILDFGRADVVDFIYRALDTLVRENDITFFKWDMNRYSTEPGSSAGVGIWRKHVEGVYDIMDRLRTAHPRLDIQSCSGGGGRIDLGILQRCDQAWTSDNTDAIDRVWIEDGYSLAYPLRAMECWVTHEHNHQTNRRLSLDLRFDVAMRGTLGIGTNIDRLTDDEKASYSRKISFYKRIRSVVQNGDLHRLANVRDGNVSVWQVVSADRRQCVYSAVVVDQRQGQHTPMYRLRSLLPDTVYRVTDEHNKELLRVPGGQLMSLGVPGDARSAGLGRSMRSRTLWIEAV
ncbi:MAG: alpha-galactosidase [Burkholderiales bacterium]|nr:alpha-galactosidase [Phycisphaerae bacterium]